MPFDVSADIRVTDLPDGVRYRLPHRATEQEWEWLGTALRQVLDIRG
jgi:hypothetical protein